VVAAKANGMHAGAYHFLEETPVWAQADHFLRTVGDEIDGLLLAVDF
jgi:GH25 family lysozyme M1 (1,4-beta-N-acetylmuramidase)